MTDIDQRKQYPTDRILRSVWRSLASDFSSSIGSDVAEDLIYLESRDVLRDWPQRGCLLAPADWMRYRIQLESFFKRWTFASELGLEEERESLCFEKFLKVQTTAMNDIPLRARQVCSRARRLCREILGKFDDDEHVALGSFSSNATTMSTKRRSDPDQKFIGPISGSPEHIVWITNLLNGDSLLRDVFRHGQLTAVQTLDYTTVPKKWDINRGIMPNTTIGSYYSLSIGRMIRRRLKAFGLNLRYAPDRHRRLARKSSIDRKLVTADLSSASDSFMSHVVNAIVPREWYNKLKYGRINTFQFKGKVYHLASFMTMGLGFTFELQTLLFYSILLAIQELTGLKGEISVFGDDLIYPLEMHNYARSILSDLGFTLNKDKTFVKENFRESCGGDYYFGVPVRPFQPKGPVTSLSLYDYQAFLYKVLNGLLERFDEYEIPCTLKTIEDELFLIAGRIYQVPPDYPDYSGRRVTCPNLSDIRYSVITPVDLYTLKIECLTTRFPLRNVLDSNPYYWNTLHEIFVRDLDADFDIDVKLSYGSSPPKIVWRKRKHKEWIPYVFKREGTFFVVSKNVPR